jgi:hypothetical protein
MNLSIQFKKKELVNTKDLTLSTLQIILLNDISFGVIIYIWYLLFDFDIISAPNPSFALIISLLQNIIVFIYLLQKKQSMDNLIKYLIILIIIKIIPLVKLYAYNKISINYFDVYSTIYLYILYIFIMIIINNILLHNNKNISMKIQDEVKTEYKKNILDNIYDTSYNDVIKQII